MIQPNSDKTTLRRKKKIEDGEPERKAQGAASDQTVVLNDISAKLTDVQAATELISDTVEAKGNQILGSIDGLSKGLENVEAASELAAEASEKTTEQVSKLNDVASAISDKLAKLSEMFEHKLFGASDFVGPQPSASPDSSLLEAIKAAMPLEVIQPSLNELLEKLLPGGQPPEPPTPPPEDPPAEEKPSKEKPGKSEDSKLDDLIKITKGGFKASVGVSDKIAGMLFKYTLTAAAEAAKLAGMMFALILGIDLIRIHFKYWSDLFNKSFEEFFAKAEEWGPLIQSVVEMAKNISTMWDEKNWSGLAGAIIKGIGDITIALADLMFLGITKITAAMLRAMGMDDKALTVEGYGLEQFQKSGAVLDEQDQDTLARYQDRNMQKDTKKKTETAERYKNSKAAREQAVNYGSLTKEEAAQIEAGTYGKENEIANLPEDQRIKAIKARNETQAALKRTNDLTATTRSSDTSRIENLDKSIDSIGKRLADPALAKTPKLRKDMEGELGKLTAAVDKLKADAKVAPAPVEEQEDTQKSNRIEQQKRANEAAKNAPASNAQVTNNTVVNKTSKTNVTVPPTSSTPAPGMGGSRRVN
ncbi:baseplate hub subunit and tail length [Escherichia phage EcS1]|uniref:Base plate hub subunit, tail length determinator n=1 Tax=Escherichia phage EcS1 TaxID=2083276 RepID=A0A2Z5ZC89_9CAUD|nr:baseplate hub subunit and tail length [Escherichia phage EcS1]BBC78259.1 Base plate hub subunit, tail length determinator [Escherichia phage EcS1]